MRILSQWLIPLALLVVSSGTLADLGSRTSSAGGVTVTVTPAGATLRRCAFMSSWIFSGVWFGTRRQLTFAIAVAGNTVFAPSPVYPDSNPFTSHVGLIHVRSSGE